ncbi:ATP binding, partial [Rhizoctonia solani]
MVNTTLYSVISAEPALKLKEERVLACAQVGHKCVDAKFEQFLHKTLAYADLDTEDLLEYEKEGTRDFEARIKWAFDNISTNYSIAIAPPRFANPSIAVRRGRMTLSGSTIMSFFDPCIHEITAGVDHWLDKLNVPHILLTGEFGNSPYLQQALQEHYGPRGIQIYYHVNNYS